jgi:nucleoside-diphosphate-sugar epimerase
MDRRNGHERLMTTLMCLGFGYCAEHFVATFGHKFEHITGTVRGAERSAILNAYDTDHLRALVFDGHNATPELTSAIGEADDVLVSVPPKDNGDPVFDVLADVLAAAKHLRSIVYLSTVGVYGDQGGDWVDEQTPTRPDLERGRERLAAERAWQDFGARRGIAVAILRLAGIYGPGQNALVQIARGKARRIVKPGQVFNRIHVGDIGQAIDAAFTREATGIFNLADDEPAPAGDPIVFAAQLMGRQPPPEIAFEDTAPSMSPMALSFWQDCRRVKNDKLKQELGVTLRYPTYREGLRALFKEMNSSAPAKAGEGDHPKGGGGGV